jgi:nitroreductase
MRRFFCVAGIWILVLVRSWGAFAQTIVLPAPQITGGKPLMQALSERKTVRSFRDQALPAQTLSNLLWAAFGVNRPASVKQGLGRTAPSAMNKQEVELYLVLAKGVYLYNAESNTLKMAVEGDTRGKVGSGDAAHAAATIVYVAPVGSDFAQVDVGFIGQNVYLFAASEGLNAWFYALHGAQDATAVAGALHLSADERPLYAQSVGYPPQ